MFGQTLDTVNGARDLLNEGLDEVMLDHDAPGTVEHSTLRQQSTYGCLGEGKEIRGRYVEALYIYIYIRCA